MRFGSGLCLGDSQWALALFTSACSQCHAVSHLAVPNGWELVLLHTWAHAS